MRSEPVRKGLAQTVSFPPAQSLAESHRIRGSSAYAAPSVDDYGSLVDLTLNSEILGPGMGVPRMLFAQISSPVVPGDPGGGGDGDGDRNGNGDGNGNGHAAKPEKDEGVIVLGNVASASLGSHPFCGTCGVQMQPAGSCFACPSCGSTSGCS